MKNILIAAGLTITLPITLPIAFILLIRAAFYRAKYLLFIAGKNKVIGHPFSTQKHWRYQEGPTCAIEAQRILLALFGIEKEISDLASRQEAYGKFDSTKGATSVKLLLEGYGVNVESIPEQNKSLSFKIWKALYQGRYILATTNSYLINNTDNFSPSSRPIQNHAIIITSLISRPKEILATYTDTGVFDGSIKVITLKHLSESIRAGVIMQTPKIFKRNIKKISELTEHKKTISCPNCRSYMLVPFGKPGAAKCNKCSIKINIDDGIKINPSM